MNGKIGIGITTHNRYELFKKSFEEIKRFSPTAEIIVVDDASKIPVKEANFRFDQNVGIAKAKNKCLELLYKSDCEHYFLFDDDTFPLVENWWVDYVNSKEPHLNYIFTDFASGRKLNDTIEIYRDSEIVAYSHARGCMMYYHRSVLEKVGGMDPVFGKWGFEHPSFSDRIFMAGMTSFRYMDIANSKGLFYSDDEHSENKNTTVTGITRMTQVRVNGDLYSKRKFSKEFIPFYEKENVFLTCYFTNVPDTQRKEKWTPNVHDLDDLIDSVKKTKLVILHDCFDEIPEIYNSKNVEFIKVETSINPYFQRWISYREYLMKNEKWIGHVFCIDGTDVEILSEPIWKEIGDELITGDEPDVVGNVWMKRHHPNPILQSFFKSNENRQLLNAGIVGGSTSTILEFIRQMLDFYCLAKNETHFKKVPDCGIGDMGVFNYIAYTNWKEKLRFGRQITTEFKRYERNNYSWFKHK